MFRWLKKNLPGLDEGPPQSHHQPADRLKAIALATSALNAGDFSGAVACYRHALSIAPDDAQLQIAVSALLIRQAAYAEARTHLNRALLLDPGSANAYYFLGKIANAQGDLSGAIELHNEALELDPESDVICVELSLLLLASGRHAAAESILLKALSERPHSTHLQISLGTHYASVQDMEKAEHCYRAALAINPASYVAHGKLGLILQYQGNTAAAIASFENILNLNPHDLTAHSSLLWLLSFQMDEPPGRYLSVARQYGAKVLAQAMPYQQWRSLRGAKAGRSALRVGFVSGDLRAHPVGFFLEGVLAKLNRARLKLIAYSMNPHDDELTQRLRRNFDQWRSIAAVSDEAVARQIHDDEVDILIDLGGHSGYCRLPVFAWKPAPVQVSWLGYLASTGVPGIDYVLADPVSTLKAVPEQFTEAIWYLPQTIFCFTQPVDFGEIEVLPPPALNNGFVTFGSFQRLNKLSDCTLHLWGRILKAMPGSKLRLQNDSMNNAGMRENLLLRLHQAGIAADRVTVYGHVPGRQEYLSAYRQVDILLDTTPHPGVTTTCEGLWMGLPTVTLGRGATLGRIGASLLSCAGLSGWVASSDDEYVALALKHSADLDGLTRLRAGLREQVKATPLFDATLFAGQFEDALFGIWRHKIHV